MLRLLLVVSLCCSCAGSTYTATWTELSLSTGDQKHRARATNAVTITHPTDGQWKPSIDYHVLARSGDSFGTNIFGANIDKDQKIIAKDATSGLALVSAYPDFTSIIKVGDVIHSITQFEATPNTLGIDDTSSLGVAYHSILDQAADGTLSIKSTKAIDMSSHQGVWNPCAGSGE